MESSALVALSLGLLLGLRHATDADHVVAISTIVSEYRNAWRGIWVGASWGLGHTTPLLIVGTAVLFLKGTVAEQYERFSPYLEFGVGIMLVFLGVQVFWTLRRRRFHLHEHLEGTHTSISTAIRLRRSLLRRPTTGSSGRANRSSVSSLTS